MAKVETLAELLKEIRACRYCEQYLPLGPNPILKVHEESRILIVGQAPGTKVHKTGIPWNDPSGVRLREWLQMEPDFFYDETKVGILPMGFCYPGKGERGDLPPRPECAELWQDRVHGHLKKVKLILAVGQYAQKHYLGKKRKKTMTETVRYWREYLPDRILAMPHPSPRNIMWRRKNPWFEAEVVPAMRQKIWDVFMEEA